METTNLLDRVLPVIGENFQEANVLCFNPDLTGSIADIAYRMGAHVSLVWDGWVYASRHQFGQSLLDELRDSGFMSAAHAWSSRIHNHMWGSGHDVGCLVVDRQSLYYCEDSPYTLVIGGGSYEDCALAIQYARKHKLPCIVGAVTKAHSVTYLSHPEVHRMESSWRADANDFLKTLSKVPIIPPQQDLLRTGELLDCIGWYTKACIMMGDKERRSVWAAEKIKKHNHLIIRGTPASPYQIWWNQSRFTRDFKGDAWFTPPKDYLRDKQVWVIGCGTGSLFIQECLPFIRNLTLIDCKPFSKYNPVRQMMGTKHVGREVKSFELLDEIRDRWDALETGDWHRDIITGSDGPECIHWGDTNCDRSAQGISSQPQTEDDMERLMYRYGTPDLVVISTGMTGSDNHHIANALRKRGIPHVIPSALPAALYHKVIVCMADSGPCYSCLQGKQTVDQVGPDMPVEARELFYGGTQPATMFETYPSARALLRVSLEMLAPPALRSRWFVDIISQEYTCLLWGNEVQKDKAGSGNLHNVDVIGELVAFGPDNMAGWPSCQVCGRLNGAGSMEPCRHCQIQPRRNNSEFCSPGHQTLHMIQVQKVRQEAAELENQSLDVFDDEVTEEDSSPTGQPAG